MHDIAEQIRQALEAPDLERFKSLLTPDAKWGPGDYSAPGCNNRNQILNYYRAGRANGSRARVTELVAQPDKLLIGLRVTFPDDPTETDRWQVMTLRDGLVAEIRGFEDRATAAEAAGIS